MTTAAPTSLAATAEPTTTATTIVPTTLATTPPPTTAAPTTAPPTTLAPTSLAATATPTTLNTTLAPTTLATTPPPFDHKADNDVTFNCLANNYAGILFIDILISGYSLSATFDATDALVITFDMDGDVPVSNRVDAAGELTLEMSISGWGVANDNKKNWVGWSKIGEANFILDRTNDAGFRPMSWDGYIYQVKKLMKDVIIYGSGGATRAFPVSEPAPTFGFEDLMPVGIKNKTAVGGNDFVHFCIDVKGALYRILPKGLEYLGFEEFLDPLTNPIMLYDSTKRRLYISDADEGYVFHEDVMTGGQIGVSGLYRAGGSLYSVGPDVIAPKPVYIVTDIIDFKRRGMKHIEDIQFGVSSEMSLYAALDFRYKKTDSFKTTQWIRLNDEGVAHVPCTAVEFRIRLKSLIAGEFDISYIKVQHKYVDQRFTRDPREDPLDAY